MLEALIVCQMQMYRGIALGVGKCVWAYALNHTLPDYVFVCVLYKLRVGPSANESAASQKNTRTQGPFSET